METITNRRVSNKNRRFSNRRISNNQVLDWSDVSDDDEVEVIQLGGLMRRRSSSSVYTRNLDPEAPNMYDEEEPPPPYNIHYQMEAEK